MSNERFHKYNNLMRFIRTTMFNIANNQNWLKQMELHCLGKSIEPPFPNLAPDKPVSIDTRGDRYSVEIKWEAEPYFVITVGNKGVYHIKLHDVIRAKMFVPEGVFCFVEGFNFYTERLEDREYQLVINDDQVAEFIPVTGMLTGAGFRDYGYIDPIPCKAAEGTHLKLVAYTPPVRPAANSSGEGPSPGGAA